MEKNKETTVRIHSFIRALLARGSDRFRRLRALGGTHNMYRFCKL